MDLSTLQARLASFADEDPLKAAPLLEPHKKQRRSQREPEPAETSELTPAQSPRVSVSLQHEDDKDSLSLEGSDGEDWAISISGPPPSTQDSVRASVDSELILVLTKAVADLEIDWSPRLSECKSSSLDAPFFPEVHEELTKSWKAPHSAHIKPSFSSALSNMGGAKEKGYEAIPPLEEAVAAHLCLSSTAGWKTKASHPSKPCHTTSALAGRAYATTGQAASALHTMAVLQVIQAKLLRYLDESGPDADVFKD
ncbi:hypothetical protein PO909_000618 [Leuciscus waleckii]